MRIPNGTKCKIESQHTVVLKDKIAQYIDLSYYQSKLVQKLKPALFFSFKVLRQLYSRWYNRHEVFYKAFLISSHKDSFQHASCLTMRSALFIGYLWGLSDAQNWLTGLTTKAFFQFCDLVCGLRVYHTDNLGRRSDKCDKWETV